MALLNHTPGFFNLPARFTPGPVHKFKGLLLFFFCIWLNHASAQVQKIYVHPKSKENIAQKKIVEDIRFIPLAENGTDISMHHSVMVTLDFYLLSSNAQKSLQVYNKDGSFVKSISYKKLGDGFHPVYDAKNNRLVFLGTNKNYKLTSKDRSEILSNWNHPGTKKYFKKYIILLNDPQFLLTRADVEENDLLNIEWLYDNVYWTGKVNASPVFKTASDHELKLYDNNRFVKGFFPYNRVAEPRFLFTEEQVNITRTDTTGLFFITRPFCDTIYKLKDDSITPLYHVVLPLENSLPHTYFTKAFKTKNERENFKRNNGWMLRQVNDFYETGSFIIFSIRYFSNFETYVYDKFSHTTYKGRNVRTDKSQYNLKLITNGGLTRNGNQYFKTIKASELLTFFAQHEDIQPPAELSQWLERKPGNNEMVLVTFTLKN